jgi:fatty-acyl-CoA synthase
VPSAGAEPAATVAELLLARAGDDRPGLLFEDQRYTWRDVVAESRARAAVARRLRGPGPFHIGVLLDNVPEYLFWVGGAALSGATVVGINPTRRGGELAADIRHTDCQLVLTEPRHLGAIEGLDLGLDPERVLVAGSPDYEGVLRAARTVEPSISSPAVAGRDVLLLLFTSGSTGAPKAVVCSQARLAAIAATAAERFGITAGDVLYEAMPLFHGNAIMANWAPALATGAVVALRRRFSASGFLPDVRRFGATYFNYVGRALAYVLATPETAEDGDNRLRLGFGTEASARDRESFERRFGCRLLENYGSSEGVVTILRQPGTPADALGLPPPGAGVDVAVVDPETGEECPRARFDGHGGLVNGHEAIGEIVNRAGAGSFEGYYNNEEANRARLRRGWYWTGDLAYRDQRGWFYFAGRSSDWLRVDSENFAAAPIERILARYPGVVMAAVYPVPDARTGDRVMAALELDTGPGSGGSSHGEAFDGEAFDGEAFATFVAAQADLGTKWAPTYVRLVGAMPLTGTNKVDKQPLRREGWCCGEPVCWRPGRSGAYRLMTPADREELARRFSEHGRAHLLPCRSPSA